MKFVRLGQQLAVAAGFIMVAVCTIEAQGANSWVGYLVDAKSAESFRSQAHGDQHSLVTKYPRHVALSEESIKAGYLIYSVNHWYRLDAHGNSLAVKALKRSIKKNGFLVHVSGSLKGDILETTHLVEMVGTPHRDTTRSRAK